MSMSALKVAILLLILSCGIAPDNALYGAFATIRVWTGEPPMSYASTSVFCVSFNSNGEEIVGGSRIVTVGNCCPRRLQ
jgi:hypothetical protein